MKKTFVDDDEKKDWYANSYNFLFTAVPDRASLV